MRKLLEMPMAFKVKEILNNQSFRNEVNSYEVFRFEKQRMPKLVITEEI
jgi:hypothetical protein